jgi:hypothetical protein
MTINIIRTITIKSIIKNKIKIPVVVLVDSEENVGGSKAEK